MDQIWARIDSFKFTTWDCNNSDTWSSISPKVWRQRNHRLTTFFFCFYTFLSSVLLFGLQLTDFIAAIFTYYSGFFTLLIPSSAFKGFHQILLARVSVGLCQVNVCNDIDAYLRQIILLYYISGIHFTSILRADV